MGAQASRLSGSLGGQLAAVLGAVATILIVGAGIKAIKGSHGDSKAGDSSEQNKPDEEAERCAKAGHAQAANAATHAPQTEPALPEKQEQTQAGAETAIETGEDLQPQPAAEHQHAVQPPLQAWTVAVGDARTLSRRQVGELWVAVGGTADTEEEWVAMCTDIGADAAAGVGVVELSEWLRARNYDQSLDNLIHALDALAAKHPDQATESLPEPAARTPCPLSDPAQEPEPHLEPVELSSAREGAMKRLAENGKELLPGTRLHVEPYGEGTYVSRHKHTFGSNTHTIQFGDEGAEHSVTLDKGASHWRVLAAPTITEQNPRRMQTFVHLFGVTTKRVNKDGLDSTVPTFSNSGKAMSKSQRHTIDLYKCQIDDRRCCQIASMMPLCTPTLARLNLDYGGIADDGAVALSLVLPDCLVLEEVSLSINAIGDTGGAALAGVLPQCTCELSTFVLRANEVGDKTMEEFSKVLGSLQNLRTLDLRR